MAEPAGMITALKGSATTKGDFMSGRNDGNSGSPETRRVGEFKDERNANESDSKGANQADGKASTEESGPEEDIEVDRQASGE